MFRSLKYRRFSALSLDLLLISLLTMLLTNNTISNPYYNDYLYNMDEYNKLVESTPTIYSNPDDLNNYVNKLAPTMYNMNKSRVFYFIWSVVLSILYFVLFQYSTGGQTIGKKLYKLKVTNKENKKISISRLFLRTFFIGEMYLFDGIVIVSILNILGILLIHDPNTYMIYFSSVNFIAIIFEIFMIVYFVKNKNNESFHDKLFKTKVIDAK